MDKKRLDKIKTVIQITGGIVGKAALKWTMILHLYLLRFNEVENN